MNQQLEKSIAKFFSLGLFVTTVIVIVGVVYDPVNISKLLVLGATALGALVVFLDSKWRSSILNNRTELLLFSWLFLAGLVATFFSTQPIQRSIYGVSGRNFGLITLVSYLVIFIVLTQFKEITNIRLIMYSFGASGLVNILYGILATYVSDPIQWNNVYTKWHPTTQPHLPIGILKLGFRQTKIFFSKLSFPCLKYFGVCLQGMQS